jgi:acetolactate synthase, large subunit (EC 2.2.1.6)
VLFDCHVVSLANCFPMIPSGKAHNEMLLGADVTDEEIETAIGTPARFWCEARLLTQPLASPRNALLELTS